MIGALEDAIICRLREAFDGRVREVDHKPARFDAAHVAPEPNGLNECNQEDSKVAALK